MFSRFGASQDSNFMVLDSKPSFVVQSQFDPDDHLEFDTIQADTDLTQAYDRSQKKILLNMQLTYQQMQQMQHDKQKMLDLKDCKHIKKIWQDNILRFGRKSMDASVEQVLSEQKEVHGSTTKQSSANVTPQYVPTPPPEMSPREKRTQYFHYPIKQSPKSKLQQKIEA